MQTKKKGNCAYFSKWSQAWSYLLIARQSSNEKGRKWVKKTAEPTPATLTNLEWEEAPLMHISEATLRPEKKQRGRRRWFWAWSHSSDSICSSIGTWIFTNLLSYFQISKSVFQTKLYLWHNNYFLPSHITLFSKLIYF